MPQVSKRKLNKDIETKMYETFWQSLASLKTNKGIELFLADLLSPVEITMLAKRLAIAVLLSKGCTYDDVKDILKVSQETISSVSVLLNTRGGYKSAIIKIVQVEKTREFLQDIERLLNRMSIANNAFKPDDDLKRIFGHRRKTLV